MGCLMSNCGAQAGACLADSGCQAQQKCVEGCAADVAAGNSTCSNLCFFEHGNEAFGALATCVSQFRCSALPPVTTATCPADMLSRPLATDFNISLLAEAGVMFTALAAADSVGDCVACQVSQRRLPVGGAGRWDGVRAASTMGVHVCCF